MGGAASVSSPGSGVSGGVLSAAAPARGRRGVSLTPLADIMFQLLIFFMLSSSLAPYALLPMTPPASAPAGAAEAPARPAPSGGPVADTQVVWHLEQGTLRAGATRIPLAALPEALAALRADGIDDIVGFVGETARAPDIADLLEPVRRAGVARLQLIGG